ncbi:hypothetical protein A9D60_08425 [Leisingera sp. JC1]|nr:hypothetical protein A9D60_08425 [Leisingera sp. JC1]
MDLGGRAALSTLRHTQFLASMDFNDCDNARSVIAGRVRLMPLNWLGVWSDVRTGKVHERRSKG